MWTKVKAKFNPLRYGLMFLFHYNFYMLIPPEKNTSICFICIYSLTCLRKMHYSQGLGSYFNDLYFFKSKYFLLIQPKNYFSL